MSGETYIELDDMAGAPGQWILSYGDLRHIGYVQKTTGYIQFIVRVSDQVADAVKMQIEDSLEKTNLPVGRVPEIDITGEGDE